MPAGRTGEYVAFERLYRENADRIFALCQRMSGDRARATEVAQDVFVRAWKRRGQLQRDVDPTTWLWHIALEVVLSRRGSERRSARVSVVEDGPAMPPLPSPPFGTARLDLDAALQSLPPRARAIYVLHDVEGHTHDAIARFLDSTPAVVREHLHRARAVVRGALTR